LEPEWCCCSVSLFGVTLVGDADRDRAVALLRRHYAEGRLDHEELARRVGVAIRARSTTDVRQALWGLPNALVETILVPRLLAAGTTLADHPGFRTVRRVMWAAVLSAVWAFATMVLFVTYAISLLAVGPSTPVAVGLAVAWALVTWGAWRTWHSRSRRERVAVTSSRG
jgi:Domain of unknown function (DUF1707)